MAKFTFEVDTETKDVSVLVNGKYVQKVNDINVHIYRDENGKSYAMDVSFEVNEYDNGVTKRTTYYGYGSEKLTSCANAVYNTNVPECASVQNNSNVANDICKFLGK